MVSPTYYEHGWPMVWMDRGVPAAVSPPFVAAQVFDGRENPSQLLLWAGEGDISWNDPKAWPLTGTFFLRWKGLLLDLCIAGAIVAVIAGCWEFWRRRRFQYSIRALLVLALLISMVMAYWRVAAIRWSRESALVSQLENLNVFAETTSTAPDWLCRLIGAQRFPSVVTKISFTGESDLDQTKSAVALANGFSKLRALDLGCPSDEMMDLVMNQFSNPGRDGPMISELTLAGSNLSEAGYRAVAKMTGLQRIEISYADETRAELDILASLPHLHWLSIGRHTQEDINAFLKRCPGCDVQWIATDSPPFVE
jgi:hypothetical protein